MINTRTLPSGVRLVYEKIPYVQSVAIGIWVKAGAVDEDKKYAGISHFIEHMMFKGTEKRTARDIARDIDKIGGQINAFTGKEATCYYVKTVNTNYKKAADVLVDMLTGSLLDKQEMDKERRVIFEEIKMTQDAPDELAMDTAAALTFKESSLGNSIIGTRSSLTRITRSVMADYLHRQYTRDSLVISVAGNIDEEEIFDYFSDKFLTLEKEKAPRVLKTAPYSPAYKTIVKDIEQSHICLTAKGVSIDDDRYYALSILNNIMGGSMSSRLFQNIREEKGLAYSVYSMMGGFASDGYFNIYAGVSHDKVKDAILGIADELANLAECGVTEEELDSSREQLKASYIFAQENVSGRMFKNGKNVIISGKPRPTEEIIEGYDRVRMEDIKEVEKLICNFGDYSAVLVGGKKTDLRRIMKGRL